MKTERIQIRTTEKTKLKLLQQSQAYNMNLSDFMLTVTEEACNLDIIQVWIHAYIDVVTKLNRNGTISHYKTLDGSDAWSVSVFKNTYFNRVELLKEVKACADYHIDVNLPRMWEVLDQWSEFVRRLKLLGMWEEENE